MQSKGQPTPVSLETPHLKMCSGSDLRHAILNDAFTNPEQSARKKGETQNNILNLKEYDVSVLQDE